MRQSLKQLASHILIPIARWYLRKERKYRYGDINIIVSPEVFHPGLFSSTGFLLTFLRDQKLEGSSLLELGCGTGLISIVAAHKGARVTASDLNAKAIENAGDNAAKNNAKIRFILSDVFEKIPATSFDWIIINPPYYPQRPASDRDLAWYCGENFEYFQKFFLCVGRYTHEQSNVIMVLTKGCDLTKIFSIASDAGYMFTMLREKSVLFDEKDFLYRIERISSTE